jgi:hypothetical protein
MVFSKKFNSLLILCSIALISCKKEVPIVFPEVDETFIDGTGIGGEKWTDMTNSSAFQALSLTVIDGGILITNTGGTAQVSTKYINGYFSGTNQTINSFGGPGFGISKMKKVNQKWYGMGLMGNYGLFEYDSTSSYTPWNPISNLNTGVNGFEIVNSISYVGCLSAPYIRYEQSGSWYSVGAGLDGVVYDLINYNGELIAAGAFVNSGSTSVNYIAKWNGNEWKSLDGGLNGIVKDLELYNGKLVAVGEFTSTTNGNSNCNNVAIWDGNTWSALSTGISGGYYGAMVAFAYKNDLLIGGDFSHGGGILSPNIIKWNGISFNPLAGGVTQPIGAITVFSNKLFVSNAIYSLNSNFILRLD